MAAARTNTKSHALHVDDGHDMIRVHGARVNNLKDISIDIPKRRLTVLQETRDFTRLDQN